MRQNRIAQPPADQPADVLGIEEQRAADPYGYQVAETDPAAQRARGAAEQWCHVMDRKQPRPRRLAGTAEARISRRGDRECDLAGRGADGKAREAGT